VLAFIREYRLVIAALPVVAILANFLLLDLTAEPAGQDAGLWRIPDVSGVVNDAQLEALRGYELFSETTVAAEPPPAPPVQEVSRAEYRLVGTVMTQNQYVVHLSNGPGSSVRLARGEMTPDGYRLDEVNDNSVTLTRQSGDDVEVLYLYQRNDQDDQQ
jgi:hypothetical protein